MEVVKDAFGGGGSIFANVRVCIVLELLFPCNFLFGNSLHTYMRRTMNRLFSCTHPYFIVSGTCDAYQSVLIVVGNGRVFAGFFGYRFLGFFFKFTLFLFVSAATLDWYF